MALDVDGSGLGPDAATEARPKGVVALPLTTRRTNQPGRLPVAESELRALGFDRLSHLLLPRAAYLPVERVLETRGRCSEALLAQMLGEMVEWYGLEWRRRDPALREAGAQARLLHPRGRR